MELMIEHAHEVMIFGARFIILGFETFGIFMMLVVGLQGFYNLCQRDPETGLKLSEGLGLALQFLMGGEILRTIIVQDMTEIFHVGGIVVLRVALTLLTHWELKNQRSELQNEEMKNDMEEEREREEAEEAARKAAKEAAEVAIIAAEEAAKLAAHKHKIR